ncbi:helix-turn-helix domain-containing protein [Nonomuraea sp. NPDC004580]|uniref:helix-turn-helix domain-containing protein n=1 Tax=Nonomuraea sp. NPDC004580 TaxID=3154552 RepID=UPI0033BAF0B4
MPTSVPPPGQTTITPLLYKPEEAAVQLRISRTKVYALLRSGAIRSVKIDGCRRIPAAALTEFIEQLEGQAA